MTIKSIFGLAATGFLLCACQSNTFQINGYARSFAEGDTICLLNESEQPTCCRGCCIYVRRQLGLVRD